ncbi:MAG: thioredoxin domain-containing protein [Puniceicoccaceae bacterium]
MPNRLQFEKSLYLRQHADNPVDWYPWGDEALKKAEQEDKPILISIGYSSCHWCHVMAHESFEDPYIAKLMNARFVCVKVDREERPDIDQIYMDAVQMLNGQGGWPLNVFCLPDGRPFTGGTYFPPDDRRGQNIIPWPQLLIRISDHYKSQRSDLENNAKAIIGNLEATNNPHHATGEPISTGDLVMAMDGILDRADTLFGGFGTAPKFPSSMALDFLLAMRSSKTVAERFGDRIDGLDSAVNKTLTGMGHGGIFDQIGGGFARYSVDQQWLIPHFEKMLYDNALLIDIYAKAFQRYPKPLYRKIVEETIDWLDREMQSPEGAYYTALDADTEGSEGATYVWNPAEVEAVLGAEDGKAFCDTYGITSEGNFENSGKSNPALLEGDPEIRDAFADARRKLLRARDERPQPGLDNKCLTSWNAMLARGLARAAFTFGEKSWLDSAIHIASWIWDRMRHDDDRLNRVAYGSDVMGSGNLNDYAHSAEAFLALAAVIDWAHPGESGKWLSRAEVLVRSIQAHFKDASGLGCFFTADDHDKLVHRKKEWFDNSTPSGNSSLLQSMVMLEALTDDPELPKEIETFKAAYPGITHAAPSAASHALSALVHRGMGLITVQYREGADLEVLREAIAASPWRPVFLKPDPTGTQPASYQLCVGTQCLAPTDSAAEIAEYI